METNMKYDLLPLEEGDEDYIDHKIEEYDESVVPPDPADADERIVLKIADDDGNVVAGLIFDIGSKIMWLHVLWVDERYRRQGFASALIRKAERTAREKNCCLSIVGSFDFQAKPFYEKHGYTVYGVVEDWPKGHCNYALRKQLDRPSPDHVPSKPQKESKYEVEVGNEDDLKAICDGLGTYNQTQIPDERVNETLGKKITNKNGEMIAAYIASIDEWNAAYPSVWVEERYRKQGIGTYLLRELERELKEKGAYVMLVWTSDWQAGFFVKQGFTVCTVAEDCPKEHCYYCMKKVI